MCDKCQEHFRRFTEGRAIESIKQVCPRYLVVTINGGAYIKVHISTTGIPELENWRANEKTHTSDSAAGGDS